MPRGRAEEEQDAVKLTIYADTCPWIKTKKCKHNIKVRNERPDRIENVEVTSRCLQGYALLDGVQEVVRQFGYLGVSRERERDHAFSATVKAADGDQTEIVRSVIYFFDSTVIDEAGLSGEAPHDRYKESFHAKYELDIG